eukprot:738749-Amphidinium_carterae.1
MTTWDGLHVMPKLWNDIFGWDAIDAKGMEWQHWMGCHCCQSYGMTTQDGMPLSASLDTAPLVCKGGLSYEGVQGVCLPNHIQYVEGILVFRDTYYVRDVSVHRHRRLLWTNGLA